MLSSLRYGFPLAIALAAQAAAAPLEPDDNTLFIGHSLVAIDIPAMVESFAAHAGGEGRVDAQIINGAPLRWHWDHGAEAQGVDARAVLPSGDYGALVLTEGVPLYLSLEWNDSIRYSANYYELAVEANPGTQVFLYETWHDLRSGTGKDVEYDDFDHIPWRDRLGEDLPLWQSIVEGVNAQRPNGAPSMRLVPAGQAMGALSDAIDAGRVPGLRSIRDIFEDDIHTNDFGDYFVALLHAGAIYGLDPKDMPTRVGVRWGGHVDVPIEMAKVMQVVAAETLDEHGFVRTASERAEIELPWPSPIQDSQRIDFDAAASSGNEPLEGRYAGVSTDATRPGPEEPSSFGPAAEGLRSPVLSMGLGGIADYSTQDPFIDIMKTSREWIGHTNIYSWGGMTFNEMKVGGYLDGAGWLIAIPDGLEAVESLLMVDLPETATSFEGRYRITYDGVGTLDIIGGSNTRQGDGEIWFDRVASTPRVGIRILATDPNGTGDYLRNIEVVRERHIEMHEAGAIFNPEWIDRIKDLRLVRFMDWMRTNGSKQSEWEDRPQIDDLTWSDRGVPLEIMVWLANEIGADPWFTMPHLASPEYVRHFAEYVRDNLDPDLRAHVENSNEIWNFQFGQTHWALDSAKARWGRSGDDAWMEFAGMQAAQIARIWDTVFGEEAEARVVNVIGVQTGWLGLEQPLLYAPEWVAEDPKNNRPPFEYFDAYAVTGYFGPLGGERAGKVRGWISKSQAAAERAADTKNLTGDARTAYISDHRHDLAVDRAIAELRANEFAHLVEELLPYHAKVATDHGLELIMYEGGTHIVGIGDEIEDQALTDFFTHLNYTPEIAGLYEELFDAWGSIGGTVFNAFIDVGYPGKYGSWGHLRHLDDENPRWEAIMTYNKAHEAWWETRSAGAFDHGVLRRGSEAGDTLTGTVEEDIMIGSGGDDLLLTLGGSDHVHGGPGNDTANLAGALEDYVFRRQPDGLLLAETGKVTVRLREIEFVTFAKQRGIILSTAEL